MTRKVASLMNGALEFTIFMYHLAYGRQFVHSTAYITSISPSTPSSAACPVGVQFSPRKRGGSALRSSTTTYFGILFWPAFREFFAQFRRVFQERFFSRNTRYIWHHLGEINSVLNHKKNSARNFLLPALRGLSQNCKNISRKFRRLGLVYAVRRE